MSVLYIITAIVAVLMYEGPSTNKLQRSIILLIFKMWKSRYMRLVGNLLLGLLLLELTTDHCPHRLQHVQCPSVYSVPGPISSIKKQKDF